MLVPPCLHVWVQGLSFEYQFTDSDVRKVFSRYGEVLSVEICSGDLDLEQGTVDATAKKESAVQQKPACFAKVTYCAFANAMAAWSDLHAKPLSGISGASLCVTCPRLSQAQGASMDQNGRDSGTSNASTSPSQIDGAGKKYTCRLEVGIENDKDFRVRIVEDQIQDSFV